MTSKRTSLLLIYLISMGVAVFVADFSGTVSEFQSWLRQWYRPVQVEQLKLISQSKQYFSTFFSYFTTADQYVQLERTVAQQQVELAELEALRAENSQLREALNIIPKSGTRFALPIVSQPYRLIEINTEQALPIGQPILVDQVLVGRISEINGGVARVAVLSDRSLEPLLAITNLGQRGLIIGTGTQIFFTEVSQQSQVSVGDRVLTAGQPGIRSGLLIGTIVSEQTVETDAVRSFEVTQPASFDTAVIVEVE